RDRDVAVATGSFEQLPRISRSLRAICHGLGNSSRAGGAWMESPATVAGWPAGLAPVVSPQIRHLLGGARHRRALAPPTSTFDACCSRSRAAVGVVRGSTTRPCCMDVAFLGQPRRTVDDWRATIFLGRFPKWSVWPLNRSRERPARVGAD